MISHSMDIYLRETVQETMVSETQLWGGGSCKLSLRRILRNYVTLVNSIECDRNLLSGDHFHQIPGIFSPFVVDLS